MTLVDGRLRFWSGGSGSSHYGRRIDPDDDYMLSPLWVPEPIENPVQPALPVPLGFSVIAPGSTDSRDAAVDMNVFHCVHGHVDEFMLRETAKSLGVDILQ